MPRLPVWRKRYSVSRVPFIKRILTGHVDRYLGKSVAPDPEKIAIGFMRKAAIMVRVDNSKPRGNPVLFRGRNKDEILVTDLGVIFPWRSNMASISVIFWSNGMSFDGEQTVIGHG